MLQVSIHTLEKTLYEGQAEVLSLPGVDGELSVLAGHIPLVTVLKGGQLRLRKGMKVLEIPLRGGFVEVSPGSKVVVLADLAP